MPRRTMPAERNSVTRKIKIGTLKGWITVGHYDDGTPGEVFLKVNRLGSFESGMCHALALMISLALQRGVPVGEIADKLTSLRFEPSGFTGNAEIPSVWSFVDYIGRWLKKRYCK